MFDRYLPIKPTLVEKTLTMPASSFNVWMERFNKRVLHRSTTLDWSLEDDSFINRKTNVKTERALLTYTTRPNVHAIPTTYMMTITLT